MFNVCTLHFSSIFNSYDCIIITEKGTETEEDDIDLEGIKEKINNIPVATAAALLEPKKWYPIYQKQTWDLGPGTPNKAFWKTQY